MFLLVRASVLVQSYNHDIHSFHLFPYSMYGLGLDMPCKFIVADLSVSDRLQETTEERRQVANELVQETTKSDGSFGEKPQMLVRLDID